MKEDTAVEFVISLYRTIQVVEATLVQIKGVVPLADCQHCAKGPLPSAQCIIITALAGQENGIVSCGNCIWAGHGERCSFYRSVHGERAEDAPGVTTAGLVPAQCPEPLRPSTTPKSLRGKQHCYTGSLACQSS